MILPWQNKHVDAYEQVPSAIQNASIRKQASKREREPFFSFYFCFNVCSALSYVRRDYEIRVYLITGCAPGAIPANNAISPLFSHRATERLREESINK